MGLAPRHPYPASPGLSLRALQPEATPAMARNRARVTPRLRCGACRAEFALPPLQILREIEGHAIRDAEMEAVGTCRACAGVAHGRATPLACASPRSLRLLVGHAWLVDPRGLVRAGLLPAEGLESACAAVFRTLALVLRERAARSALDALLRPTLGQAARPFEPLPVADLVERLAREAPAWSRTTQVALLLERGAPARRLLPQARAARGGPGRGAAVGGRGRGMSSTRLPRGDASTLRPLRRPGAILRRGPAATPSRGGALRSGSPGPRRRPGRARWRGSPRSRRTPPQRSVPGPSRCS